MSTTADWDYVRYIQMRTPGVEPGSQAWEAYMMPLHPLAQPTLPCHTVSSRDFNLQRSQIEGLESQNHCLFPIQSALWEFKSPRGWAHFSRLNFWKLAVALNITVAEDYMAYVYIHNTNIIYIYIYVFCLYTNSITIDIYIYIYILYTQIIRLQLCQLLHQDIASLNRYIYIYIYTHTYIHIHRYRYIYIYVIISIIIIIIITLTLVRISSLTAAKRAGWHRLHRRGRHRRAHPPAA